MFNYSLNKILFPNLLNIQGIKQFVEKMWNLVF